jgi:siderophore synthetase component
MAATPAINDCVLVLKRHGFSVLREIAAARYHGRHYENATEKTSPYRKLLSTLEPGERLAAMASLLHLDRHGSSLAAALISASGLAPADWLRAYVDIHRRLRLHLPLPVSAARQRGTA